ncbi:MAG TPA: class I SAM-dependent methyltransferase [Nocardioidaceae bacterium]|nr:class I SAM-dependent methyltransferase [Nocardioidaceae bacterium]
MTSSLEATRAAWDAEAAAFDDEPDHGLRDPAVRDAWRSLLLEYLPPAPARVADLGCGSGSLSVLLAEQGYDVSGIDLSDEMLARSRAKASAAGVDVSFTQGDASSPDLEAGSFDVVLCRHVLWALPEPSTALGRWVALLAPGGRLVLVEGSWSTGAGLTARRTAELVGEHRSEVTVRQLPEPVYWGKEIDDERYLVVSE